MPWKSEKQRAWGNSPAGKKALGEDAVDEFNEASKGKDIPKMVANRQRGRLKRAEHMGKHMSTIHDTGDE